MRSKALTLVSVTLLALAASACGGGDAPPAAGTSPTTAAATAIDPASITDPGSIGGTISFSGDPGAAPVLQMAADPNCVTANGGAEVTAQRLVVNDNGTLRHVFVYVKEGLDQAFTTPAAAIELDQTGCMYTPHVVGVQVGQTLRISNSDDTLHNVNSQPANNAGFNNAQVAGTPAIDKVFDTAEVMIPVKCDVHPWMQAYVAVLPHPYFSVSGEDGGFTISGLPAGDYVVAAWHESLGEQTRSVSVAANETAEVSFEFGG